MPYWLLIHRLFRSWYAGVLDALKEEERFDWRRQDWGTHDGGAKTQEPASPGTDPKDG